MTDKILKLQAFKLKGRLYTLTVMQILETDIAAIAHQMSDMIEKAPRLFENTPIILDCSSIQCDTFDLQAICQCLREFQLIPVGIQGASPFLNTLAQALGMAIVHASSAHDKSMLDRAPEPEAPVANDIRSKLLTTPVRSGQQVVGKSRDLIITASVSHGAELLADGNIHVYGTLRGRALAGMTGDIEARIFCLSLEAELVSIAGFYRLSDAIEPINSPCQIYLQDERIHIEPL